MRISAYPGWRHPARKRREVTALEMINGGNATLVVEFAH